MKDVAHVHDRLNIEEFSTGIPEDSSNFRIWIQSQFYSPVEFEFLRFVRRLINQQWKVVSFCQRNHKFDSKILADSYNHEFGIRF